MILEKNKLYKLKKYKSGFSLLEVMIALIIAGIIGMSLYQMVTKTQKTVQILSGIMDVDSPIMPLYAQLEKDIAGIFVPQSSEQEFLKSLKQEQEKNNNNQEKESSEKEQAEKNNSEQGQEKNKKNGEAKNKQDQEGNKKKQEENGQEEKIKAIENVFVVNSTPNFYVSFITTGGIQEFNINQDKVNLKPEPYMRRVNYILKPDPNTNLNKLYYSSNAQNLELKINTKDAYIIANNIKEFKLNYSIFNKDQLENITDWNQQVATQYKSLIPAYITINVIFVDQNRELPFEFKFKVLAAKEPEPNTEVKQEVKQNAENNKK